MLSFGETNESLDLQYQSHKNMKKVCLIVFSVVLFFGCEKQDRLVFENYTIENEDCGNCPKISIQYPLALGQDKLSKSINIALSEEVIEKLTYDDDLSPKNVEEAMQSFSNSFLEIRRDFPDTEAVWEATIEGSISNLDENYLTIQLKTYIFSGGAHGYQATQFLNFDLKRQIEIDAKEMLSNLDGFIGFAEKEFRIQENIPLDQNINSTGFMFPEEQFVLPENMGYTPNGFLMWYNQYEIASYADGPISILLTEEQISPYRKKNNTAN